jgi:hypothetical protein
MLRHFSLMDPILLVCLIVAWFQPKLADGFFDRVEKLGSRLAARKRLAIFALVTAAILARVVLLGVDPVPVPQVHDEFSYLLAGDTFAHGRLTNPTHAMWIFFDTFHVNQNPTYMSKYPPAQGAALALGERLGNPWIGVLLSMAFMCAAILWMLQGWLPPRWALLGGILVLLRFSLFNYWIDSYWGGAMAAAGGALLMGALPRILRRQRVRDALIFGLGAAILANSRPFEGLLLFLTTAIFLAVWLFRARSPSWRVTIPRVMVPLSIVLLLAGAFIGYYNWRGTGRPWLLPFTLNTRTYMSTPIFLWQKGRPPLQYLNDQFESFYNESSREYWLEWFNNGTIGFLARIVHEIGSFVYSYLWPELCVPLLALPCVFRDKRLRFGLVQVVLCLVGSLTVVYFWPHYLAPATATVILIVIQSMRHLRRWKRAGRPVGVGLTRVIVLFAAAMIPVHIAQAIRDPSSLALFNTTLRARARIAVQLEATPGEHLVIVRYSDHHSPHEEWVYNAADIDHAKIVWAREIADEDIRPLLDYFLGRKVWLVEPDSSPPRLLPYSTPKE